MDKRKILDIILSALIVVGIIVVIVLGIKIFKAEKKLKEVSQPVEKPVVNTTVDITPKPEVPVESIDETLQSKEVTDYFEQYNNYFGSNATLVKETKNKKGPVKVYSLEKSDVRFKVQLDKNGLVKSVGSLYNALGTYPLVSFTGTFPEDKNTRIAIYKTLQNNGIYNTCTVYFEGEPDVFLAYPTPLDERRLKLGEW